MIGTEEWRKRQEENTKTSRSFLLCEAALPPAVFVSPSLLLPLCSCFKLKAGSLKGRFFFNVWASRHTWRHRRKKERAELGGNALQWQQHQETLGMFLVSFLSVLEATVEADTPPSCLLIDVCFYIRLPYPIMLHQMYHHVFQPCSVLQT